MAAWTAASLGAAHAAITLMWLGGSTFLLDTIGGDLERLGRQRSTGAVVALAAVFTVKAVVAVSALLYAGIGDGLAPTWWFRYAHRPRTRALGWLAAGVMIAYGGVLTVVGLAVQADIVDAASDADRHALAWHAFLWDPWFLAWGSALAVTLGRSRRDQIPTA